MTAAPAAPRTLAEGVVAQRLADLRARRERRRAEPEVARRIALREAGAVLAAFDPGRLAPFGGPDDAVAPSAIFAFLGDCEPIAGAPPEAGWRLRIGVRQAALRRLGTAGRMREALAANPARADSAAQRMLEAPIEGQAPPAPANLSRDELLALATAVRWLEGLLDGLPDVTELELLLAQAELLEPLRRLADTRFVGRERELARLAEHLDGPRPDGPLVLHGPGGVGKSALLARFIMEHVHGEGTAPRPFVRLDADRPSLDPVQPLTFLIEALRQLSTQVREVHEPLLALCDAGNVALDRVDAVESTKSFHVPDTTYLAQAAGLLGPTLGGRPLLFIVDTFEAVQTVGEETADLVLGHLGRLVEHLPQARVVISGRVAVPSVTRGLPVQDLEPGPAKALMELELAAYGVGGAR